jgi:hypothetical protein
VINRSGEYSRDKLFLLVTDLISEILFLPTLFFLAKLLKVYEQGDYFSKRAMLYFHRFAWFLLFSQVFHSVFTAISSALVTLPGSAIFSSVLMSVEFKQIFLSVVILLISYIMQEEEKLQDDYNFTV